MFTVIEPQQDNQEPRLVSRHESYQDAIESMKLERRNQEQLTARSWTIKREIYHGGHRTGNCRDCLGALNQWLAKDWMENHGY